LGVELLFLGAKFLDQLRFDLLNQRRFNFETLDLALETWDFWTLTPSALAALM